MNFKKKRNFFMYQNHLLPYPPFFFHHSFYIYIFISLPLFFTLTLSEHKRNSVSRKTFKTLFEGTALNCSIRVRVDVFQQRNFSGRSISSLSLSLSSFLVLSSRATAYLVPFLSYPSPSPPSRGRFQTRRD